MALVTTPFLLVRDTLVCATSALLVPMKLLLLLCEAIMALHCTAARRALPAACLGANDATRLLCRA
jgi:hypothetical protein